MRALGVSRNSRRQEGGYHLRAQAKIILHFPIPYSVHLWQFLPAKSVGVTTSSESYHGENPILNVSSVKLMLRES
jgi:hypothetical protein